jgi:hypothetical protein
MENNIESIVNAIDEKENIESINAIDEKDITEINLHKVDSFLERYEQEHKLTKRNINKHTGNGNVFRRGYENKVNLANEINEANSYIDYNPCQNY